MVLVLDIRELCGINSNKHIGLHWVPGCTVITRNERADEIARYATQTGVNLLMSKCIIKSPLQTSLKENIKIEWIQTI